MSKSFHIALRLVSVGTSIVLLAGCSSEANNSGQARESTVSHNAQDVQFATQMIPHHRQAVEMAQLVIEHGESVPVRRLAERIVAAQQPEIDQLSGFLQSFGAPVPSATDNGHMNHGGSMNAMGMMTADQMAHLAALRGRALDTQFLSDMIEHHTGAIQMANRETARGKHAPAKALAEAIASAQADEIAQMRHLLDS